MAASWPRTVAHVDQRQNGPQIMQGSIVNDEDYVHANETKDEEEKEILEGMTHRQNNWPPQIDEQYSINHKEDKTQTQENYTDHSSKADTNATISLATSTDTSNSKSDYVIRVSFLWFLLTMFLIALSLWTYPSSQDTLLLVSASNLTLWIQENQDQYTKIKACNETVKELNAKVVAENFQVQVAHQAEAITNQKYEEAEAAKKAIESKFRECENKLRKMESF